ncbi:DnaT-like ssDNA-binding protein [Pseudomonas sp. SP16.1]|uniref:DnaT-like ssDNA-binding protein n=1 Tax=Pseudomonas sp. SP16.1 TaxID=3458854 RepID=UPI0040465CBA
MTLIIEDGSIVPGADSFATAAELVTYAANFGRTIPGTEADQESLLRRAALQMDAMNWKGEIVQYDQALSWPRYGVYRGEYQLSSDSIPAKVKAGQMALATEIHADDLAPPELKVGAIESEKVGPISTTFAKVSTAVSRAAAGRQSEAQFAEFLNASNQVRLARG